MKIKLEKSTIEISNDNFQAFDFGIKTEDMGFILSILRSKIYENPIQSIVREISCNARDANREVGKSKVPIKITITDSIFNPGEKCINFIDNGPGITPERMADVFINYGSSTKRDTNKLTGGFGLGAKTPFSYTDNFSIITIVNKVKYIYCAVIEENQAGKIYKVSEEKTEDCNGTTISIPIKPQDKSIFIDNVFYNTYWWEIAPEINFNNPHKDNYKKIEFDEGFFLNTKSYNNLYPNNYYLLIDNIPYELNNNIVELPRTNGAIFLTFKNGVLNIGANRENVTYDTKTISTIKNVFNKFKNSVKKSFQDEINMCKTYIQAERKYNDIKINKSVIISFLERVKDEDEKIFFYNNYYLNYELQTDNIKIFKIFKDKQARIYTFELEMETKPFYYVDTKCISEGKNKNILQTNDFFYVITINNDIKEFNQLTFRRQKSLIGIAKKIRQAFKFYKDIGLNFKIYSEVKSLREKNETVEKSVPLKYVNSSYNRYHSYRFTLYSKKIKLEELTVNKNIIYFTYTDNCNVILNQNADNIEFIITEFGYKIYFVHKNKEKYIKDYFTPFEKIHEILPINFIAQCQNIVDFKYLQSKDISEDKIIFLKNLNFKPEIKDMLKNISTVPKHHRDTIFKKISILDKFTVSDKLLKSDFYMSEITKNYPLLKHFGYYNCPTEDINEYIKTVDENKQMKFEIEQNKQLLIEGVTV